jgi:hypothetical protein
MSKLVTAGIGAVLAVATWILLFVILGFGLGTSFIAFGVVLAAGVIGAGMISVENKRAIFDAPLTSVGLLTGAATFAVLEIVLSVPMWVGVISALGAIGIYDLTRAILFPIGPVLHEAAPVHLRARPRAERNGHGRFHRETAGAR